MEGEEVTHIENISIKLDAKWIDLFWDSSRKKDSDISYMRFFSRLFACRYLIDNQRAPKEMRDTEAAVNLFYTQTEKSKDQYLGFDKYAEELQAHPEYFTAAEKVLDTLQEHQVSSRNRLPLCGIKTKEEKRKFLCRRGHNIHPDVADSHGSN